MKEFFCTRPTLASYLLEKGFTARRTVNPYDTKRPAWVFAESPELLKIVDGYYAKVKQYKGAR